MEIGKTVRVANSNNPYWGSPGVVKYIVKGGCFDTYVVNMEPNHEEGEHLIEFSENELEEITK